jgi:ribosome biogenesis GTPase
MSDWSDYDETHVRVRPNPKGTKPRTKVRPEHSDAVIGRVISVDRGRYTVLLDSVTVSCSRARELARNAIVTGDRVDVVGDVSGAEGSLARIVRVHDRETVLRRSADDTDSVERIIVANADQLLIVIAAAHPEPRVRLVDRYLVAAFDAGIEPLLCITKCDLADPDEFLAHFAGLNIPVFRSASDHVPVDALQRALAGHTTVAVGHSGVGKSTLVNALVPHAQRATGHVNEVTGRGRHTSSSTVSLVLESPYGSGWVIDTPGVRSFGLGHVNPANILGSFPDLNAVAEQCPRGCSHLATAPDCALNEALEAGELGEAGAIRVDSLQRLLTTFGD